MTRPTAPWRPDPVVTTCWVVGLAGSAAFWFMVARALHG